MLVIPIAGCDPTSLCRFCLVLVLVVCFSCFCCVVFGLLFCFLVLLLGQFLDCVLVHNRHFCGFRQGDSPACKLQFNCLPRLNVCNDLAEAMKALDGKKTIFDFIRRGRFLPNGRLGVSPELPQRVSCLRFHIPSVPYCVVRPLGCVMVYFN